MGKKGGNTRCNSTNDCTHGIESGVIDMSGAGWPATGGGWEVFGCVSKAGAKVGSAPWQFPAGCLRRLENWSPRELPSLRCPAGHRFLCKNIRF